MEKYLYMPLLAMMLLLAACNSGGTDYNSAAEALQGYTEFAAQVRNTEVASADDFIELCKTWHSHRNAVILVVDGDTDKNSDKQQNLTDCFVINDTIRGTLCEHLRKVKLSFSDYISVREALSDVTIRDSDKVLIDRCEQFFIQLDKLSAPKVSKAEAVKNYNTYLDRAVKRGFSRKDDVLEYITQEDLLFRSFLMHMSTLGETSLQAIRDNTVAACRMVMNIDDKAFSHDEAVAMMTMRANRRLLQNAERCMSDIKRNRIRGETKSAAYLWMLVQPIASVDDVSMAMMTNTQRVQLRQLAKELPGLAKRLQMSDGKPPLDIDKLPNLLTRDYILGSD